jgi:hypothetical protein
MRRRKPSIDADGTITIPFWGTMSFTRKAWENGDDLFIRTLRSEINCVVDMLTNQLYDEGIRQRVKSIKRFQQEGK